MLANAGFRRLGDRLKETMVRSLDVPTDIGRTLVYHYGTPMTSFAPSRRSSKRGAYFLDSLRAVWEHCAGHCIEPLALSGINSSVKLIRLDTRFDGTS